VITCDCGRRATAFANRTRDPICARCHALDGSSLVEGAIVVELAQGDAELEPLAVAVGASVRQTIRCLRRLGSLGRVVGLRDPDEGPTSGATRYRLANPARVSSCR
jgi:hypothetical protein